jgi:hypothetical protein
MRLPCLFREQQRGISVIASTFQETHLPQCNRGTRLGQEMEFRQSKCDELTAGSICPQPRCAMGRLLLRTHISWKGGRGRDQKESVETDPGSGVVAIVRLRGCSQCTKRFEPAGEFRPVRTPEAGAGAQNGRRGIRQIHHQCRTGKCCGEPGKKRVHRGRARESHWQERGRASCPVRPTNKRGGSRAGKNLALSRGAVHRRHPALPGCADAAVRNSCVRGKER